MKIYTGTGDEGQTSLLGGQRVAKDNLRVEAYGTVDEASSWLGLARAGIRDQENKERLKEVQQKLQLLAAELASPPGETGRLKERLTAEDIGELERAIDAIAAKIGPQKGFVLPGGTLGAGYLDVARTVVRRAERVTVILAQREEVRKEIIVYLNRLSDLLYLMARQEVFREVVQQVTEKVKGYMGNNRQGETLSLAQARKLMEAAEAKAGQLGVPVVTAVVDGGGNLLSLDRQDGALLASIELARGKAYTAVALKMPTHEVAKLVQPGGPLYGIENFQPGSLVVFGGGYPLYRDGQVVGGIGVSGGTVAEDMIIARAAVELWEEVVGHDT
ncbi:MAG TPA: cob(I)yrinic acid a,c-diamide adenosyltransferase [Firmicutes bacterium]|nr:cob(I)yrinic acid a,c-diamide adenosyltransferase [Bacillota bacterium]